MPITIITVDKKRTAKLIETIETYQKRLQRPFDVQWVYLHNSSQTGLQARQEEAGGILKAIPANAFTILLDETGKNITSPELAAKMQQSFVHSRHVTFIIGGAYGVSQEIKDRADFIWSLSNLVFPHQIVRLLLIEQIYRAQSIVQNTKYHHA